MDNVACMMGRFANQLWELSAATIVFGKGNFKANLSLCGTYEAKAFENFQGIDVKQNLDDTDCLMKPGYYQHKRWLADPNVIKSYIRKPDDIPHLPAAIHIRLDDYTRNNDYAPYIIKRRYIEDSCKKMGLKLSDCVVFTDSPEAVHSLYGDDLNVYDEKDGLRAFWMLVEADYLICSASTYSYWAAYLGNHKRFTMPIHWHFPVNDDDTIAKCTQDLFWF